MDAWRTNKKVGRQWYADGVYAFGSTPERVYVNIDAAVQLRNGGDSFHRVFSWTYQKISSIEDMIRRGCDGVMVNTGPWSNSRGRYPWMDDYEDVVERSRDIRWAVAGDFLRAGQIKP